MSGKELQAGEKVILRHGPFRSLWTVHKLIPAGAVLMYAGQVEFVGFSNPLSAPNGDQLTDFPMQEFVGRSHFKSLERFVEWPGNVETSIALKIERRSP